MSTKLTVIVDNIPHGGMRSEWGLSILAEYKDKYLSKISNVMTVLQAPSIALEKTGIV